MSASVRRVLLPRALGGVLAVAAAGGVLAATPPAATAAATPTHAGPAKPGKPAAAAKATASTPAPGTTAGARRPLTLDTQRIEGRTDAPRVLFIHTGPVVALEDAPKHPSYLRDDFTAALSAPIRVRVHAGEATRPSPSPGGTR